MGAVMSGVWLVLLLLGFLGSCWLIRLLARWWDDWSGNSMVRTAYRRWEERAR